MMGESISIIKYDNAGYPGGIDLWAPDCQYPEYAGRIISAESNIVYQMFREALVTLGLDSQHIGTAEWNPLGDMIKPGNSVVIKPNLVRHYNPEGTMECLITNVSLVRAVIDYVLIALKGEGKIIVGDAPVQTCDFESLVETSGYRTLIDYYQKLGCQIELKDFRCTVSSYDDKNHLHQKKIPERVKNTVVVNLGRDSAHYASAGEDRLRITNYPKTELLKHHRGDVHEYCIAKDILDADVIINIPKPKTHRKAGITGALKNMVGACAQKEYLPHHRSGSILNGGDEYPVSSVNKALRSQLSEAIDDANEKEQYYRTTVLKVLQLALYAIKRITDGAEARNEICEGSWSGNDTIWRTVNDINRIVFYADAKGQLHSSKQRKMLVVADMIEIGEGEGPLLPNPRQMNEVLVGTNPCVIDKLIAKQFGIDENTIPSVKNCEFGEKYRMNVPDAILYSNDFTLNNKRVSDIDHTMYEKVKMPSGWKTVE